MGAPGPDWTPAEDYILLNEAGLKASKVMALLPGRTAHAIRSRRKLLMKKPPGKPVEYRNRWTEEDDDKLRELASQGLNYSEIGAQMDRTPNGVKHRMCKLGEFGEQFSFAKEPPKPLDPWPDLGPNAFRDVKVSADPPTTLSRPETRTNGGVGSRMLVV